MAEVNPPYVLQAGSHPADNFRRVVKFLTGGTQGAKTLADLTVTANGTPNMSVNVASGEAIINGTQNAVSQGAYHVFNDATKNLTIAASDATNPRQDLVIAQVLDGFYAGTSNVWQLVVLTGTPAATPVDPAVPANAITLARVAVAANATSIAAGNITDLRTRVSAIGGVVVCTSATRPASPSIGVQIFETDTGRMLHWTGTKWTALQQGREPDQFFADGITGGTATAMTAFATHTGLLVAPYDLTMHVTVTGNSGFSGANNILSLQVQDEAGANILYEANNIAANWQLSQVASNYYPVAVSGKKNYTAGQTCGFQLAYLVSASNTYLGLASRVEFLPR